MKTIISKFWNDQHGFIVSAELVLVATIAVLAMVVGLSEVALNVNNELEDVGAAFGKLSQSYSVKGAAGCRGRAEGSQFQDSSDACDGACDINPTKPVSEY